MLKIRRSHERVIFNMGIPIPGKDCLYIESGPSAADADKVGIVTPVGFNFG